MLAEKERRRWDVALGALAVLGLGVVVLTILRPEVVAEHFLPDGVDPRLAWTFVVADLFAYVVLPGVAAYRLWHGSARAGDLLSMATCVALYPMAWVLGDTIVDLVSDRGVTSHWAFQSTFWPFLLLTVASLRWNAAARSHTEDAE